VEGHDDKYKSLLDERHHVEDRAGFEYTNAPKLQKEYEWVGSYTTICIQTVFSNLAKRHSRWKEVTSSDRLCCFARLLLISTISDGDENYWGCTQAWQQLAFISGYTRFYQKGEKKW
jgi:hypothetical protein